MPAVAQQAAVVPKAAVPQAAVAKLVVYPAAPVVVVPQAGAGFLECQEAVLLDRPAAAVVPRAVDVVEAAAGAVR